MVRRPPKLSPLLGRSITNDRERQVAPLSEDEALQLEAAGFGGSASAKAAAAAARAAAGGLPSSSASSSVSSSSLASAVSAAAASSPSASSAGSSTRQPPDATASRDSSVSSAASVRQSRRVGATQIEFDDPRKELGHGEFGTVYLGYVYVKGSSKVVRKPVAVKEVMVKDDATNRELGITKELRERRHDNIVKVYETTLALDRLQVVMEYMDAGTLKTLLERVRRRARTGPPGGAQLVDDDVVAALASQVLSAVNFLHSHRRTLHRDIKPDNLLLNYKGCIKLADFGFAKECGLSVQASTFCGTGIYMSPTRMEGRKYGSEEDIWSLGVTLAEVACGSFPFTSITAKDIGWLDAVDEAKRFGQVLQTFSLSRDLLSYLSAYLQPEATCRATALQLLSHPFVDKHVPPPTVTLQAPSAAQRESRKLKIVRMWIENVKASASTSSLPKPGA